MNVIELCAVELLQPQSRLTVAVLCECGLAVGFLDFFSHRQLEVHDVALVFLHFFVVANPQLLGDLADEAHVVGHQNHTTFELVDGFCQAINGVHVQRVRRLVQQQQVGLGVGHDRKHDAGFLPRRELAHDLRLHCARAPIAPQPGPDLVDFRLGHDFGLEVVDGGLG